MINRNKFASSNVHAATSVVNLFLSPSPTQAEAEARGLLLSPGPDHILREELSLVRRYGTHPTKARGEDEKRCLVKIRLEPRADERSLKCHVRIVDGVSYCRAPEALLSLSSPVRYGRSSSKWAASSDRVKIRREQASSATCHYIVVSSRLAWSSVPS